MKKLLLISLLIVGCDRYEFENQYIRYDKWTGNVHHFQEICEELGYPDLPAEVANQLIGWRLERKDIKTTLLLKDEFIYRNKRHEFKNPHVIWEKVDNQKCEKKWIKQ